MKIFTVLFKVSRKFLDSFGKKSDLILRRAGIFIMPLNIFCYFILLLVRERHNIVVAACSFYT